MIQKIPIFIPNDEAEKYMLFLKHYDLFTLLLKRDVFNQKNASVTLDFDNSGILSSVRRTDILYSKRHEHPTPGN